MKDKQARMDISELSETLKRYKAHLEAHGIHLYKYVTPSEAYVINFREEFDIINKRIDGLLEYLGVEEIKQKEVKIQRKKVKKKS